MRYWLQGKKGGFVAFLLIAALVAGGLGGVTLAALRMERQQLEDHTRTQQRDRVQLALWHLDSLIGPALAKEDSRPYNHYSAVSAPPLVLQNNGTPWPPGSVLELSPLLNAELPEWMLLHFQFDKDSGWRSPQVLSPGLVQRLRHAEIPSPLTNASPGRTQLLTTLSQHMELDGLLVLLRQQLNRPALEDVTLVPANGSLLQNYNWMNSVPQAQAGQIEPQKLDPEFITRSSRQGFMGQTKGAKALNESNTIVENNRFNGENWFGPGKNPQARSEQVPVALGPMLPVWMTTKDDQEMLLFVRHIKYGQRDGCQGIVLDWPRLQTLLANDVKDEFPRAQIQPLRGEFPAHSERTMTVLPLQLDPGPEDREVALPGWTPLRSGLALAWMATLVGLATVGLGGWSLLDLSERRIRFVSAVTHELRTPLTTLRLYLDMLAGGMVKDEKQKDEYLHTLNAEADRLNRLIGNVLDFSRLENRRLRPAKTAVMLQEFLEHVYATWQGRCQSAGKELVLENRVHGDLCLMTDSQLAHQILGNLIDNACKYSCGVADPRLWLRARTEGPGSLILEVEDRGPGVPPSERRAIFRPFRRGHRADVTAGGVGLGLALAQRWARLLGGRLRLCNRPECPGACFRIDLPL
jgi:signal transduction histidine kinase